MTLEEFKLNRVRLPSYGTAPAALVAKYEAVVQEMDRAYSAGASLSSDEMLALNEKATAIANEITKYHPAT